MLLKCSSVMEQGVIRYVRWRIIIVQFISMSTTPNNAPPTTSVSHPQLIVYSKMCFCCLQEWTLNDNGLIQHDDICLSMPSSMYVGAPIIYAPCGSASLWRSSLIKGASASNIESRNRAGFCISASADSTDLVTAICDPDDYLQKFEFN